MATARSSQLTHLLPAVRAGVRAARLRPPYADDALQDALLALVPHLDRLATMPDKEARAYVFVAASRAGMAIRKRVGLQETLGSETELVAWENQFYASSAPSPEQLMQRAQSAERANAVIEELVTRDKQIIHAIADNDMSGRDAARELDLSRGKVGYRLRLAREAIGRAWMGTTSWAKGRRPV
jgi:RNA polymerase sigma factor (sigma-70 family)